MEQFLSNEDIWLVVLILFGILYVAVIGNLYDPNSKTNDLAEILAIDEPEPELESPSDKISTRDANIARARKEIYDRLQARAKAKA